MDTRQLESAYHQMKERAVRDAYDQHRRDMEDSLKYGLMQSPMMDPRALHHAQQSMMGMAGASLGAAMKQEEKTKEPTQQAPDNKLLLLL